MNTLSLKQNLIFIKTKNSIKKIIEEHGFPLISKQISFLINSYKKGNEEQRKKILNNQGFDGIPKKYWYLLDEKFDCSNICCKLLRKDVADEFSKTNNSGNYVGVTVYESKQRFMAYSSGGCIHKKHNTSWPIALFSEKEIWECVKKFNIKISPQYELGYDRTGCLMCGYGKNNSNGYKDLYLFKKTSPKLYEISMNYKNNGVTYREALKKTGIIAP